MPEPERIVERELEELEELADAAEQQRILYARAAATICALRVEVEHLLANAPCGHPWACWRDAACRVCAQTRPLLDACRAMLEGVEELVRDGGGHYETDAAVRDAEMLRKAIAAAGRQP